MINVNSNHKISHFCTTQLWEAQKYFVSNDINIILLKKYMKLFKKKIIIYRETSFLSDRPNKYFFSEYLDSNWQTLKVYSDWSFVKVNLFGLFPVVTPIAF